MFSTQETNRGSKLRQGAQEPKTELYKAALDNISNFIKTSTSSMTAVPKPLKFLRPHYETLEKLYESWPAGDNKVQQTPVAIFGPKLKSLRRL